MPQESSSKVPTLIGLALAGTGVAHFVRPELFEGITKSAFPDDTAGHVKIDGGIETVIGLALAVPKTRKLAVVGLASYGVYMAVNIARNR